MQSEAIGLHDKMPRHARKTAGEQDLKRCTLPGRSAFGGVVPDATEAFVKVAVDCPLAVRGFIMSKRKPP